MKKSSTALDAIREALDEIGSGPGASNEVPITLTMLEWHTIAMAIDPTEKSMPPLAQAVLIEARRRFYKQVNAAQDDAAERDQETTTASHLN
jgi:hypothetical protein